MAGPGATAGASLTASNTLGSVVAHLAAEEQVLCQTETKKLISAYIWKQPKLHLNKLSAKAGGGRLSAGSKPVQSG